MLSMLPLTRRDVEAQHGGMTQELLEHTYTPQPAGLRDRLLARVLAPSLDRQLASGRPAGSSRALANRAEHLTSPEGRRELVQRWAAVLDRAGRPPALLTSRAPLSRGALAAAEQDVREMLAVLAGDLPIDARGAATASWLLSDGTGPLYNLRSPVNLGAVVREATQQLDAFAEVSCLAVHP
jgi:hypothetical protein